MVRHIVSWNFRPEVSEETKKEVLKQLQEEFPKLVDTIPGLTKMEPAMPPLSSSTADAAIYAELTDEEALEVYRTHPDHVAIAQIVRTYLHERHCVNISI
ncbi:MAG: Dabb family protein [Clostridiales bacterium]|nr:Dabb family protein [Clostridiales bacterium]